MPTSGQGLSAATIKQLITQRVAEAMADYEEIQNNKNKNGNPNVNVGGVVPIARECTYQDFVKCQPLNFKGTEGVIGLTRWFEKIETDSALTWYNSHKRTIGTDVTYAMTWKALIKLMTEGNDLTAYTQRFQELILLCTKMVLEEEDLVEKFIGGLPNNIQGNKLKGYTARNAENKRRVVNNPRDNRVQQPPFKRQNMARAYTVGNNNKKGYAGILPLCDECMLHHHCPCPVKCGNCKKVDHQARDCWTPTSVTC
ncbi:hypothetical protein Tco_1299689 [Tanacetum coccineum]